MLCGIVQSIMLQDLPVLLSLPNDRQIDSGDGQGGLNEKVHPSSRKMDGKEVPSFFFHTYLVFNGTWFLQGVSQSYRKLKEEEMSVLRREGYAAARSFRVYEILGRLETFISVFIIYLLCGSIMWYIQCVHFILVVTCIWRMKQVKKKRVARVSVRWVSGTGRFQWVVQERQSHISNLYYVIFGFQILITLVLSVKLPIVKVCPKLQMLI